MEKQGSWSPAIIASHQLPTKIARLPPFSGPDSGSDNVVVLAALAYLPSTKHNAREDQTFWPTPIRTNNTQSKIATHHHPIILKNQPTKTQKKLYHLESRWRNSHVLLYHGPLLNHILGVAASSHLLSQQLITLWKQECLLKNKLFYFHQPKFSKFKDLGFQPIVYQVQEICFARSRGNLGWWDNPCYLLILLSNYRLLALDIQWI